MSAPERPDLAQMAASLPQRAGPSSVDMQAAAQRATEQPYVEYDGERWDLQRLPDMFDLGELGEAIDAADQNPIFALGAINRCLRQWLADYPGLRDRFRAAGGQMDDYVQLAQNIFVAVAARPTGAPGDSSPGREPTSTSSKADAPSPTWTPPAEVQQNSWQPFTPA